MDEETKKALVQRLHLDKPILAIHEEQQCLTLYLLGGAVVQVENVAAVAQLPFDTLAYQQPRDVVQGGASLPAEKKAKRGSRKG